MTTKQRVNHEFLSILLLIIQYFQCVFSFYIHTYNSARYITYTYYNYIYIHIYSYLLLLYCCWCYSITTVVPRSFLVGQPRLSRWNHHVWPLTLTSRDQGLPGPDGCVCVLYYTRASVCVCVLYYCIRVFVCVYVCLCVLFSKVRRAAG